MRDVKESTESENVSRTTFEQPMLAKGREITVKLLCEEGHAPLQRQH